MDTPILVIGFNRPEKLKMCLQAIVEAGGSEIYIFLDGPRKLENNDLGLINQCKQIIKDFEAHLEIRGQNFQGVNMGCKEGVKSAINWFFQFNTFGVIIEDDVLITRSFLNFCSDVDGFYRHNSKVFQINGWVPFQPGEITDKSFLTRYAIPWGWATWKTKWEMYEEDLTYENASKPNDLLTNTLNGTPRNFELLWRSNFLQCLGQEIDTWDYQWIYSIWLNGGFAISPPYRLTTNIGFDTSATHTRTPSKRSNLPAYEQNVVVGLTKFEEILDEYFGRLHFGYGRNRIGDRIILRFSYLRRDKNVFVSLIRAIFYMGLREDYLSFNGIKLTLKNLFHRLLYFSH